ncbi:hypothetical protein [Calycomorphotria hydatis]|uniref:Phage major tail protein 2 n=1 Tax=Calycomorphotria hydatis TaxID=2528027 RepID=A0A517TFD4_9PLAN|nr:hypothetical protein [Calycomorphotria hydatis]QDT67068.1 hypothetical protein V22_43400 [Calycomorphotria hydatis]
MAVSNITRNLRDGELVIKDGTSPTPLSLTVLLDEGDLSWSERSNTIEVKDRGSITDGHTRIGEDESVSLSFSAKWTQLIGKAADAGDPLQLYEVLTFASGTGLQSTSADGEQQTLQLEFTITDPAGVANELITFSKVYREQITMSEGEDYNTISFSGRSFETQPTISRS